MAKITVGLGFVLIALGLGSYFGTGRASVTALIPASGATVVEGAPLAVHSIRPDKIVDVCSGCLARSLRSSMPWKRSVVDGKDHSWAWLRADRSWPW